MSSIKDFFITSSAIDITAAGIALINKETAAEQRTALGVLPTTSSATEPAEASIGDKWFDTVNNVMMVYSGTIWHQMSNV